MERPILLDTEKEDRLLERERQLLQWRAVKSRGYWNVLFALDRHRKRVIRMLETLWLAHRRGDHRPATEVRARLLLIIMRRRQIRAQLPYVALALLAVVVLYVFGAVPLSLLVAASTLYLILLASNIRTIGHYADVVRTIRETGCPSVRDI